MNRKIEHKSTGEITKSEYYYLSVIYPLMNL